MLGLKPIGYDDFMESINLEYMERSNKTTEEKKKDWKNELICGYRILNVVKEIKLEVKYTKVLLNKSVCSLCVFCEATNKDCWVLCSDVDDRITFIRRKSTPRRKIQIRILNRG